MKPHTNQVNMLKVEIGKSSTQIDVNQDIFTSLCDSFFTLLTVEDSALHSQTDSIELNESICSDSKGIKENYLTGGNYLSFLPLKNTSDFIHKWRKD